MATLDGFFRDGNTTPEDDLYILLGCDESSSIEQITKEYHIKAKLYHPDRVLNLDTREREEAGELFRKINRAYEILSDSEKRQVYDNWRRSGMAMTFDNWLSLQTRFAPSMHFGTTKKQLSLSMTQKHEKTQETILKATDTSTSLLEQFRTYKI